MSEQNTLRDTIAANLDAAEAGTLGEVASAAAAPATNGTDTRTEEERSRDTQGRFATRTQAPDLANSGGQHSAAAPVQQTQEVATQRPTTWKKEYLPIYDKLAAGIPLTPEESKKIADYSGQREREYATGVSTYRAEAQNAKEIQTALEPYLPELQKHNLTPAVWIKQVADAHQLLSRGTPQQKLDMFMRMAHDFNVPIQAIGQMQQQGQVDPMTAQWMQQMQELRGQVSDMTSWRDQQELQMVAQHISEFEDASKYPHFQQVRGTMAQLLEKGLAQDLQTAYETAVRMDGNVWQAEQERQAQLKASQTATTRAAAVTQAKANAVSPRSTTPSGAVTTAGAKDRRALLSEALDAAGGRV
jgi:hypothetical protein